MRKITLLTVGRVKTSWINEGCSEFIARLRPSVKLTITEIPPSRQKDGEKQRQEESEQILHALEPLGSARGKRGDIFLLDEAGERMTSKQFSVFLSKAEDLGLPLTFILGGAYGVSDRIREVARGSIRLSDMTLTHEMTRLLFLEQLYRAMEIRKGSGYHH